MRKAAKSPMQPVSKLYDEDFVVWATETARLLREGRFNRIDIEHLVEEIEAMAGDEKRKVLSRLRVLILHLLKWRHQPKRRSRSWKVTIVDQRAELEHFLESSPSLRRLLPASVVRTHRDAVNLASIETGLPEDSFPRECPFSPDQILDHNFLPDR